MVPIVPTPQGPRLVLTKRSAALKAHPGQISFPGGRVDPADPTAEYAALREAWEETGLDPASVEILGRLPSHRTVTAFTMTPVVGWVSGPWNWAANPGEVDEIFDIPLSHALDADRFNVQSRNWMGQARHYYTVPIGPYYIWGATARILRGFAARFENEN